jgi:hypothetical protein
LTAWRRLERSGLTRLIAPGVLPWLLASLVLVLLRCAPSMLFEQLDFDSDQAIVGLMAKHLAEGRHFPLFFYGQQYMLGVQAWIAAPFFLLGGPTVAMLRLPLAIINMIVVGWLLLRLIRQGVGAGWAFVATLPLIAIGPIASTLLMETLGASVEPLLYVLLLWCLRDRAVAFGALFCVSYLHRELTLFVLPALVIVWLLGRPAPDAAAGRYLAKAVLAFAAVWIGVAELTRRINTLGPPGGLFAPGSLRAQSEMVVQRLSFDPAAYLARLAAAIRGTLPDLFALHAEPLSQASVRSGLTVGSLVGGIGLGLGLAIAAASILFAKRTETRQRTPERFHLYLALVGVQSVLAYALNGGLDPGQPGVPRYVLFALLLPIAVLGAFVEREPSRRIKLAVASGIGVWAAINVANHVELIHEYLHAPPPNEHRELADYLVSHRIRYGRAEYWDAYLTDFLSRERVILTPTQAMRVGSYDARVTRNESTAVVVRRQPCDSGARVASWCIDDPLHR